MNFRFDAAGELFCFIIPLKTLRWSTHTSHLKNPSHPSPSLSKHQGALTNPTCSASESLFLAGVKLIGSGGAKCSVTSANNSEKARAFFQFDATFDHISSGNSTF
jgi:hypothetical protein